MRLLFWVATALEWRAACPQCTAPLPEQTLLDFMDERGRSHLLCITGVGPVNAALAAGLCLGHLAAHKNTMAIDAAVNLGIAGSFDLTRAPLGSAWRVTHEIWPEYGLVCDGDVNAHALGFAQWQRDLCDTKSDDDSDIWESIHLPSLADLGLFTHLHEAILSLPAAASLTVAGVTGDTNRASHLYARHGALLENMEGFALALACARHGLPLLELRTVSNVVGPRAPSSDIPQSGVSQHRDFSKALAALQPLLHNLLNMAENN